LRISDFFITQLICGFFLKVKASSYGGIAMLPVLSRYGNNDGTCLGAYIDDVTVTIP
jgi:hypothetical protein